MSRCATLGSVLPTYPSLAHTFHFCDSPSSSRLSEGLGKQVQGCDKQPCLLKIQGKQVRHLYDQFRGSEGVILSSRLKFQRFIHSRGICSEAVGAGGGAGGAAVAVIDLTLAPSP